MDKVFTLEEVRSLLPELRNTFREIMEINEKIKALTTDLKVLFDIWGDRLFEAKNPDNLLYVDMVKRRDFYAEQMKGKVAEMQERGCAVKDIDNGLIDFPFDNNGVIVFLCWKYGEEDITHWHGTSEGFAGRKQISQLSTPVAKPNNL